MTSSTMGGALRKGAGAVVLALAATTLFAPAAGAATERNGKNYAASFPSKLERGGVTLRKGSHRVSFALDGATGAVTMRKRGATVTNALPGVSLLYSITPTALKEGLVLTSSKAPRAFRFTLDTGNLTPVLQPDESIALRDGHGTTRMTIPAPFMFDTDAGDVDVSHDVAVSLVRIRGGAWRYTLRPDRTWLTASDRAFPVVVDPTIAASPIVDPIGHLNTTIKGMFYSMGICGRDSGDPYCRTYAPVENLLTNRGIPGLDPNCDINGNPKPCKPIKPDPFTFVASDIGKPNDPETVCTVTHEQANPAGRLQYRGTNLCEMVTPVKGRITSVTIQTKIRRPDNSIQHESAAAGCAHTDRCGLDPNTSGYTDQFLFAESVGFHTVETIVRLTLNEPTDVDPWLEIDKRADTPPDTRLEEECLPGAFVGADGVVRNRVTIRCRIRTLVEITSGPGDSKGLPVVSAGVPQAPSTPRIPNVPRVPAVPALPPVPSSPVPVPSTSGLCLKDPFAWGCPLGPIGP